RFEVLCGELPCKGVYLCHGKFKGPCPNSDEGFAEKRTQ
ncbi:unnamed protein product, partial [Allacma fusca]